MKYSLQSGNEKRGQVFGSIEMYISGLIYTISRRAVDGKTLLTLNLANINREPIASFSKNVDAQCEKTTLTATANADPTKLTVV